MPALPVNDAQAFITKLNASLTDQQCRLPTEAEWEYACLAAGKESRYCGRDSLDAVAWYQSNSGGTPHPVKGKQPNAHKLYDMSGNVSEWVQDRYHDNYQQAPADGSAWELGTSASSRVLRGGS